MTTPGRAGVLNLDTIEDWAGIRSALIDAFNGEIPGPHTDERMIEAFIAHPDAVRRELQKVAHDFAAGTIRSGWAIAKTRAERVLAPPSNPTATSSLTREKAIGRAEQWIRSTGAHLDRESEIVDDLFAGSGLLAAWATDTALRQRMIELWTECRPTVERLEREADEFFARWKAQQEHNPRNGRTPNHAFPTPPPS